MPMILPPQISIFYFDPFNREKSLLEQRLEIRLTPNISGSAEIFTLFVNLIDGNTLAKWFKMKCVLVELDIFGNSSCKE